jgi:hypothetical protein
LIINQTGKNMSFALKSGTVAMLSILTSIVAINGVVCAQVIKKIPTPSQPIKLEKIDTSILRIQPAATVSGKIVNGGSNNGGAPNFSCNDIKVYAAIATTPTPNGGIQIPTYQQIGSGTKASGDIKTGCSYKLNLVKQATNKPIYLFGQSPQSWTSFVNIVDVVPKGWSNPTTVANGANLTNMNMEIRATAIK